MRIITSVETDGNRIDIDYNVNYPDLCNNNYIVYVTSAGISFLVNADTDQEALDYVMDYCVDECLEGLYTSDYDEVDEREFITAGNYSYGFTTHNIRTIKL